MNLFFVTKDGKLVTPELTGTILEGVTRSSVLELAKELGLEPEERRDPHRGVEGRRGQRRHRRGLRLRHGGRHHAGGRAALGRRRRCDHRNGVDYGEVTRTIRERLLDIQYGRDRGHPRLADPAGLIPVSHHRSGMPVARPLR